MRKLSFVCLLLATASAYAQDYRSERMPSNGDRDRPEFVLGVNNQKWTAAQVNWYYSPADQPANLSTADVLRAIQVAAARWSGMCNVTFNYLGTTTSAPNMYGDSTTVDQANVFGWGVLQNGDASFSALTKTWFVGSSMIDADIMMNTTQSWTILAVEAIMTHELGHSIGINHSNVAASVMFANPYHTVNYMRVLRGDDAEACASLYGAATTARSNRVFNWAEATYPQYLSPGPAASGTLSGYYYRYYPGTNSYTGSKDGIAYYMSPDGAIHDMGSVDTNWLTAILSGY